MRWISVLVGAVAVSLALTGVASAVPPCYGAAARDPDQPCRSAKLPYAVEPSPDEAQITPDLPCQPIESPEGPEARSDGYLTTCAFGVPIARSVETVALVGDSHAKTFRAALGVVARGRGWRVLDITRSKCPFTLAVRQLPSDERQGCERWKRRVLDWFDRHPEVRTVVVRQQAGGTPVFPTRGRTPFETAVAGFRAAWRALPASVEHVVVVRDNPRIGKATFACVRQATARGRLPGPTCSQPRRFSLAKDPAVVAARRGRSRRVSAMDLTHHMCSRRRCFPVVGGALVNKDTDHMTLAFATSLGRYVLRELDRLAAGW